MKLTLNDEQQIYFNEIVESIKQQHKDGSFDSNYLMITGKAGTGKSFLSSMIVKYFQDNPLGKKGIQCTALTHKALNELRKKLTAVGVDEMNLNGVSTIHSYFQIKPTINTKTGVEEFTVQKFKKAKPDCEVIYY